MFLIPIPQTSKNVHIDTPAPYYQMVKVITPKLIPLTWWNNIIVPGNPLVCSLRKISGKYLSKGVEEP